MLHFSVTKEINNELYENVTKFMYPRLNEIELKLLNNYFCKILEFISMCNYLTPDYINFFRQDNYKDLKWLITYLLPYDVNDMKKNIDNLSDIYTKKFKQCDINKELPKYMFSNLQYNRCIRDKGIFTEIKYNEEHIKDNYYLLLQTIKTMRNKFHINWYNVVPCREDTIRNSRLYLDTLELKNSKKYRYVDVCDKTKLLKNLSFKGLTIDEIYDTISLDLYESVLPCKWLIFDIVVNNEITNIISIFDILFDMTHINKSVEWNRLDNDDKNKFSVRYDDLKKSFNQKIILKIERTDMINYTISFDAIEKIIKSICMYFDTINKSNNLIKYTKLNSKKIIIIDDIEEEEIIQLDYDTIQKTFNSISDENMYNFICESIQQLKNTWYYINTKINDFTSSKNIYNFSKSFVHFTDVEKKFTRLPRYWCSLTDEHKFMILSRFNDTDTSKWFNIANNLRNIYTIIDSNISSKDIYDIMESIYRTIHINIVDIIFQTLIRKGVLTEFVNDIDFSKERGELLKKIRKSRFVNDNPYGKYSYYYLTNEHFNDLEKTELELNNKKGLYGYFDICMNTSWYIFDAYNWVSQIGFCHRFIHNRVNYITGATSSGKSTQIPKLYAYYLKSISHINDPTVIITVPRLNILDSTGGNVALEMGTPYKDVNNKLTYFSYVQFESSDINNVTQYNIYGKYPKIRFVTDGIMLGKIQNIFFKLRKSKNSEYTYTRNDICNVLIVDEAHEHNVNMDIILTFSQFIVTYNNKIKLGIVSATLDNDEPIYRRYFRDVNDNRKYPLDMSIQKNIIDRCNTERRFHISSPFNTTLFKIREVYEPNKKSYEIVRDIIKTTDDGEILLFHSGKKEITDEINILNTLNYLPDNVIALPYYKDLDDDVKKFIININKNKKFLKINKQDLLPMLPDNLFLDEMKKGNNTYTRVIVVSTNIAEASVTIEGLTYIVDTGKEKTNIFDHITRTNIIKENYIPEESRIQRRGRVGRVGQGTVYYNYKENQLIDNVKQYKISIEKLDLTMLQLLKSNKDKLVFSKFKYKQINDMLFNFKNPRNIKISKEMFIKLFEDSAQGITDIMVDHYVINNEFYCYYGNTKHYDYNNIRYMNYVYNEGLDYRQLIDKNGDIFIIHPDELNIRRNIGGKVISSVSNTVTIKDNMIISNKIGTFWKMLLNACLIGEYIENKKKSFSKTKIGNLFQQFINSYRMYEDIEEDFLKILFYGYGLSENDEQFIKLFHIIRFITSIKGNINKLFLKKYEKFVPIFSNTFGQNFSDLETLNNVYEIAKKSNIEELDSFKCVNINTLNKFLKRDAFKKQVFEVIVDLRKYMYHYRLYMNKLNIDLIKGALLLALPYNIIFKISGTNKSYSSLYKPSKQHILTTSKTFIIPHKYVLYINKNTEFNNVSLLTGLKKEDLLFVANIYRKTIVPILEHHTYVDNINKELVNAIIFLKTSIEDINIDLSYVINNTHIWNVLSDMNVNISSEDLLEH